MYVNFIEFFCKDRLHETKMYITTTTTYYVQFSKYLSGFLNENIKGNQRIELYCVCIMNGNT
jgi:hypothetical protein